MDKEAQKVVTRGQAKKLTIERDNKKDLTIKVQEEEELGVSATPKDMVQKESQTETVEDQQSQDQEETMEEEKVEQNDSTDETTEQVEKESVESRMEMIEEKLQSEILTTQDSIRSLSEKIELLTKMMAQNGAHTYSAGSPNKMSNKTSTLVDDASVTELDIPDTEMHTDSKRTRNEKEDETTVSSTGITGFKEIFTSERKFDLSASDETKPGKQNPVMVINAHGVTPPYLKELTRESCEIFLEKYITYSLLIRSRPGMIPASIATMIDWKSLRLIMKDPDLGTENPTDEDIVRYLKKVSTPEESSIPSIEKLNFPTLKYESIANIDANDWLQDVDTILRRNRALMYKRDEYPKLRLKLQTHLLKFMEKDIQYEVDQFMKTQEKAFAWPDYERVVRLSVSKARAYKIEEMRRQQYTVVYPKFPGPKTKKPNGNYERKEKDQHMEDPNKVDQKQKNHDLEKKDERKHDKPIQRKIRTCFKCNSPDHIAENCPKAVQEDKRKAMEVKQNEIKKTA